MGKIFKKISSVILPQRGREAQSEEHGRHRANVIECGNCQNVYFRKRWYSSREDLPKEAKDEPVSEDKCPACTMADDNLFEGEMMISNCPDNFKTDLINLINNFCREATRRDPQDRLLKIENKEEGIRVTTTEDQMAVQMAKKIKSAFNNVNVDISYASEPKETVRIKVDFK